MPIFSKGKKQHIKGQRIILHGRTTHFIFNSSTRTMLPGYHLHFVLRSKNVSAARSFFL